ncbi:hypothetical protein J3R83DRAFT_14033 [Lanmaoa asiatica]|nr:hypothetical protein J3R83DRAFT_14033 [Lanmaoa asiatica]
MTGLAVDRMDPWKEDGNIVLAAEGKYFRVHRSILSAHSEVFKDMFDFVHSDSAEKEFIELYPVIHLHDAAADVQIMLKALYDRRQVTTTYLDPYSQPPNVVDQRSDPRANSYPIPYYEKMPFSIVAAFLHLGDKYAISALVTEAKARLCCVLEPTLSAVGLPGTALLR